MTSSNGLVSTELADSSQDASALSTSQRVVVFCLLALEGDAVSACILFRAFPIEKMFPAAARLIHVGDHSGERVARVLSLFVVCCCVGRFLVSQKGVFIIAVIFVVFRGHGWIKGPKNLQSSPGKLNFP